jgi:hypothetical protein
MDLRRVIFGAAVFILTMFVSVYGVNTAYPAVKYDDYCPNTLWQVTEMNQTTCFNLGGKWVDGEKGYCNQDFYCSEKYNLAQEHRAMNVFMLAVPLGILMIVGGFYFFSLDAVSTAIMAGGVGTLLRGISNYWRYSQDWLRFAISLGGLIIVVWFGYRFFESSSKKKVKKKKKR